MRRRAWRHLCRWVKSSDLRYGVPAVRKDESLRVRLRQWAWRWRLWCHRASHMAATALDILRVAPLQEQSRFFVAFLLQIMLQLRVRAAGELTSKTVNPFEYRQQIRF